MTRSDALQAFLDAAFAAFDECAQDLRARRSVMEIFAQLEAPHPQRLNIGKRLPVCSRHIENVLATRTGRPSLDALIERFADLEPMLEWKCRSVYDDTASENFLTGHANTMIVGPGGLEDRRDLWFGATLMSPNVRYPDHDHAPEETYLVLSEGEFQHGTSDWFSPGVGGSFYNPPEIRHAMRSGEKPLFALWALLPERSRH
ncbi:dimethylsulfonioproprionate lyase family protein (plasmid) [Ensifer adhaerens]|uniref:dimethylsulfonioproprionate lyase family protein n=1 Tax=Ensifer adhaerens TaxID=106592 RepID=UPI0023AA1569|nr:dimethylsulfonioproprionate lyase family protein [Ensifer adhaerens]WDZ80357.1 dimethylsulfonioproprionate lyase family protein [Ensifer adhaerens]